MAASSSTEKSPAATAPASEPVSVSVLPSGKPAASSVEPPKSTSNSSGSSSIMTQLAKGPAKADAFLAHLLRVMQSRAGTDAVLMFACYATRVAGSTLELGGRAALHASAKKLVATLFKLPPSTTVVVGSATAPPLVAAIMDLGARFKAYSGMLSEMRTMGRLWGLLGLYFAAKRLAVKTFGGTSKKTSEKEKPKSANEIAESQFDTLLAWAQIISLIIFQGAENAYFLAGKKVLPFSPKTQGKLALISVRSWGLYVAMEASRLLIELSRKRALGPAAYKDAAWAEGWNKAFYRNLAWAPLTVHWGTVGGVLPDVWVSLLAFYPAASGMREMWKSTA
ncbi:hypothetical protein K4F52_006244 [Lecanicillium sp. MT-2017a]|nr:hypothetical protein K4F52_006244 [Lecanicillium sp. MT-2017a]